MMKCLCKHKIGEACVVLYKFGMGVVRPKCSVEGIRHPYLEI